MTDIGNVVDWVVAISTLCNRAIAARKTITKIADGLLTQREKDLLISAHHDGLFHTIASDLNGRFVATNTKEFTNDDPAETAHYLDAFIRLCDRGLIIHQSEDVFRLTGQGFDLARKLSK
jgi:hypothetical protein